MTAHDNSTQGCPCACCPRYEELNTWADSLEEIAVEIERSWAFYLDVKSDIIDKGWESEYARIGISGYRDRKVPNQNAAAFIQYFNGAPAEVIFAEDLTAPMLNNDVARPGLVSVIRQRAAASRALAERGLAYCQGNSSYIGQDADSVLDYFCTLDPDKVDDDVWGKLFEIGYIDLATYQDIGFRVVSERWARAELIASVATVIFAWRAGLAGLARSGARGLVRLTALQARRLKNLAQKRPPIRISRPAVLQNISNAIRRSPNYPRVTLRFKGVGHSTPWGQMSPLQKKKFQHSYTRHASQFGLPNWSQKAAESLRQQFNTAVGRVRAQADEITFEYKPVDGVRTEVRHFRATLADGNRYYYYELVDTGHFISAGR